jgi:hypothetical protein
VAVTPWVRVRLVAGSNPVKDAVLTDVVAVSAVSLNKG